MSYQLRCSKCHGITDSTAPLLNDTCSACLRNESLLRGQQKIARDQERYAGTSGKDYDYDINSLKSRMNKCEERLSSLENRMRDELDTKLKALAQYFEQKLRNAGIST